MLFSKIKSEEIQKQFNFYYNSHKLCFKARAGKMDPQIRQIVNWNFFEVPFQMFLLNAQI